MRPFYILLPLLAFCAAWIPFRFDRDQKFSQEARQSVALKKQKAIRCSPDWNALRDWLEEGNIPPIPGAGKHTWKISTVNDSAQFYFNQGINMYYGFHIIEAMASFKKAALFDPSCAMLYWAQALSYGPNINDYGYRASPDALAAMTKANELKSTATPFEQNLINAMQVRYTADSADATRASLNQAYADAMKRIASVYKNDAEALTLYADAMMLQHPWDLWTPDGQPKPWTPAIRQVLEETLDKHPNHPGANHYYIHVMEPSPFAEKAMESANRLGTTNPGLSHMVHMSSHIYLRTGDYEKGVDVNTKAVESYKQTISLYSAVTGADFLYFIHNLHMKANNAMMGGNFALADNAARDTRASVPDDYLALAPPFGSLLQYIQMTPVFVHIRFGKWTELLKEPAPDSRYIYASIIYHFGRGMALAKTEKISAAKNELLAMEDLMKDSILQVAMVPFSPPIDGAIVASDLLAGTIALQEKNLSTAITRLSHAVTTEKNMVYNEPRDWLLNPRHYLGNAYLVHSEFSNAEKIFRDDLAQNNDNVWALIGLYQSLKGGGKNAEAKGVSINYKKALTKADVSISASVY